MGNRRIHDKYGQKILLHIQNKSNYKDCSILTGTFPKKWKEAEVIPILKDIDHEEAANNRSLSLLTVASKVSI